MVKAPQERRDEGSFSLHVGETSHAVPSGGVKTVVLAFDPALAGESGNQTGQGTRLREPDARLEEAVGLAQAIGLNVVRAELISLKRIVPATLIGGGKVEEIGEWVQTLGAELVIFDGALAPLQQRNLERALSAKVLDRTGLILEIFGSRARTKEGSLQVELAHLNDQSTRLVRTWTHLERQRGGFGFLGGPGETQIETDRRLIRARIRKVERQLEKVRTTRALHRAGRERTDQSIIALVGYTNAGKSTLFNRLTGAGVRQEDAMFATLDPTLRRIELADGQSAILSDTVGFVSDLPTTLVAAFRATLEEVIASDVILHVHDVSHPDWKIQSRDVEMVLAQLGIESSDPRIIHVFNKVDRLTEDERRAIIEDEGRGDRLPILFSALTGEGIDDVLGTLGKTLSERRPCFSVEIPIGASGETGWLYRHAQILDRHDDEAGVNLTARIAPHQVGALARWARSIDASVRRLPS